MLSSPASGSLVALCKKCPHQPCKLTVNEKHRPSWHIGRVRCPFYYWSHRKLCMVPYTTSWDRMKAQKVLENLEPSDLFRKSRTALQPMWVGWRWCSDFKHTQSLLPKHKLSITNCTSCFWYKILVFSTLWKKMLF